MMRFFLKQAKAVFLVGMGLKPEGPELESIVSWGFSQGMLEATMSHSFYLSF